MRIGSKFCRFDLPGAKSSFILRYAQAVALGILLLEADKYLFRYFDVVFFSIPLVVIALLTYAFGADTGLILIIIVGTGLWYFFLEPRNTFKITTMKDVKDTERLIAFFIASGMIVFLIGLLKQARNRLQTALKEKEVLLKELYHRTKNNLQVASSLVALQCSRMAGNELIQTMCADIQNRFKAMAMIHEKLYKSKDLANVNMKNYVENLSESIMSGYPVLKGRPEFVSEIHDISLPIELAVPCGLIINELMSNSLKYAFPDGRGRIDISMRAANGMIELIYNDSGPGLPQDFDIKRAKSLGLKLVNTLATRELKGSIDIVRDKGCGFVIKFPGKE